MLPPRITVFVNGVAAALLPAPIVNPEGTESSVSTVVFGSSRTLFVSLSPLESVAVSVSSRYDGYSWSGAVNEPWLMPVSV